MVIFGPCTWCVAWAASVWNTPRSRGDVGAASSPSSSATTGIATPSARTEWSMRPKGAVGAEGTTLAERTVGAKEE